MDKYQLATLQSVKPLIGNNDWLLKEYEEKLSLLAEHNKNLTDKLTLELYNDRLIYVYVIRRNGKVYALEGSKGKLYFNERKAFSVSSRHNDLPNEAGIKAKAGKQPNFIGVLTDKKVNEWLDYCDKINDALEHEWQVLNEKVQTFYVSLSEYPVKYSENRKKGYYILNGLKYSFYISNLCIYQSIEVHPSSPASFQMFLKLSNNALK